MTRPASIICGRSLCLVGMRMKCSFVYEVLAIAIRWHMAQESERR
jgi:hypothetical protein